MSIPFLKIPCSVQGLVPNFRFGTLVIPGHCGQSIFPFLQYVYIALHWGTVDSIWCPSETIPYQSKPWVIGSGQMKYLFIRCILQQFFRRVYRTKLVKSSMCHFRGSNRKDNQSGLIHFAILRCWYPFLLGSVICPLFYVSSKETASILECTDPHRVHTAL